MRSELYSVYLTNHFIMILSFLFIFIDFIVFVLFYCIAVIQLPHVLPGSHKSFLNLAIPVIYSLF